MAFYHNLVTEKSWLILKTLHRKYKFILIGGWAVFLYTQSLKSKDVDLICSYKELSRFKKDFEIIKNQRLKKYEFKIGEVDVDVYLPHFSKLGIPVEEVEKFVIKRESFNLPRVEILCILKQTAHKERIVSIKGKKDKIDIISLLKVSDFDFKFYIDCLKKYECEFLQEDLIDLLKNVRHVPELDLNEHQFAKFRKMALKKLNKI